MAAPTLEVRNLRTHFFTRAGVVKAVDDVSFTVERGKALNEELKHKCVFKNSFIS